MNNQELDKLVASGMILRYEYGRKDDDGNIGVESRNRNTEYLILHFCNGEKLILDTFCSGSSEDTILLIQHHKIPESAMAEYRQHELAVINDMTQFLKKRKRDIRAGLATGRENVIP